MPTPTQETLSAHCDGRGRHNCRACDTTFNSKTLADAATLAKATLFSEKDAGGAAAHETANQAKLTTSSRC